MNLERVFDALRELVWKAWTDPEHLARWWGPKGFTNVVHEWDARPGGNIHLEMIGPDGSGHPMGGTFHEVVEPERLVFTSTAFEDERGFPQLEALNTVTFVEEDGRTRVTLNAVVQKSAPAIAEALAGMSEGWSQSLDKLADSLVAV